MPTNKLARKGVLWGYLPFRNRKTSAIFPEILQTGDLYANSLCMQETLVQKRSGKKIARSNRRVAPFGLLSAEKAE
jgi:hypothetical protein